ncbi:Spore germination lipase LipC [Bacillus sp. THAF10]|nr:Spore germination lipase LipC [Bacillus sp. THAF10]
MLKKFSLFFVLLFASSLSYAPVIAESPKELTYLAIGDSLTAGLGSSEENYLRIHGFVPQFTKFLREENNVKVENYGIPGLTSSGLLAFLSGDEAVRNRLKTADIITVSIGGNDLLQALDADFEEQSLDLRLEILNRTYKELFNMLQEINPNATLILLGLYNPYPEDHKFHELAEEYAPQFNTMVKDYAEDTKSRKGKTLVVDPFEAFLGKAQEWTHIKKDDIHPNDKGYTEIVRLMKNAYKNP